MMQHRSSLCRIELTTSSSIWCHLLCSDDHECKQLTPTCGERSWNTLFFFKIEEHRCFLWGHCYPWFGLLVKSAQGSKPGWIPHLHVFSLPAYYRFLRFTSGMTPADLLMASMTAEPFQSTYLPVADPGFSKWGGAVLSQMGGRTSCFQVKSA